VGDIVGLSQKFEVGENLDLLAGLKPLKFKILNLRASHTGEK
jgi:hypothetical protein